MINDEWKMENLQTLAKEVGSLDEKGSTLQLEARFMMSGERAIAVVVESIVVADIESRAGIWRPAKEVLPVHIGVERGVIETRSHKEEAGELILGKPRVDIADEDRAPGIFANEFVAIVVKRAFQRRERFIGEVKV